MPGAAIQAPPDVRSFNGTLGIDFFFRTDVDVYGLTKYCYITSDGTQSPTLRVNPGDEIVMTLNEVRPT